MAVSVTFMSGVVVGWLLNTYTRKVGRLGLCKLLGGSTPSLHHRSECFLSSQRLSLHLLTVSCYY